MQRDMIVTNRQPITRWLDQAIDELQHMRSLIAAGSSEADETLLAIFNQARDARADWATSLRKDGELVQNTAGELSKSSVGEQMNQMLFGSMFRRKPRLTNEREPIRPNKGNTGKDAPTRDEP
jgi:prephenate dehydrogenase